MYLKNIYLSLFSNISTGGLFSVSNTSFLAEVLPVFRYVLRINIDGLFGGLVILYRDLLGLQTAANRNNDINDINDINLYDTENKPSVEILLKKDR